MYSVHGVCEKLPEECALMIRQILNRKTGIHRINSFEVIWARRAYEYRRDEMDQEAA